MATTFHFGAVQFPSKLMKESDHDWNLVGTAAMGGQNSKSAPIIRSDGGGYWSASLNNIRFWDETDGLVRRALRQQANGGATSIVVPRNDVVFRPWPAGAMPFGNVPFGDGSLFDDGTGFDQAVIDVVTYGDQPRRSTVMTLQIRRCAPLRGGESFSINHYNLGWRLYEIASVEQNSVFASIRFNPPLREAVPDSTAIEFDQPRCTMRLASPSSMDLNVTTWPFSLATVKFIEVFA